MESDPLSLFIKKRSARKIQSVYRNHLAHIRGPSLSKENLKVIVSSWNKETAVALIKEHPIDKNKTVGGLHGEVFELGTDMKYVLKHMSLRNETDMNIFRNEIRVGTIPGIQSVGPKIYAWKTLLTTKPPEGIYIMDHILRGEKDNTWMTLAVYLAVINDIQPTDPVFVKLRRTLRNFWLLTKGYHGDLHYNNIAVVVSKKVKANMVKRYRRKNNVPREECTPVVRVVIYDYGAHKLFKTPINKTKTTFLNLANVVNRNFKRSLAKRQKERDEGRKLVKPAEIVNGETRYYTRRKQPRRSNIEMVRKRTPHLF